MYFQSVQNISPISYAAAFASALLGLSEKIHDDLSHDQGEVELSQHDVYVTDAQHFFGGHLVRVAVAASCQPGWLRLDNARDFLALNFSSPGAPCGSLLALSRSHYYA